MGIADGWDSNRGIVLLRSPDLTNWRHSRINLRTKYGSANSNWRNILSAWAPEIVYDRRANKYMVTWSTFRNVTPEDHIIYWVYANNDFTDHQYNKNPPAWGYWVSDDGFKTWKTQNQSLTVNGFYPRHGHIIPITRAEYDMLNNYRNWPVNIQ